MRLSVDNINRKSPYWVIQLDDITFRFVTKNGIVYRVGFYKDPYFLGDKAYHFFIANENESFAPKDTDVYRVITYLQHSTPIISLKTTFPFVLVSLLKHGTMIGFLQHIQRKRI